MGAAGISRGANATDLVTGLHDLSFHGKLTALGHMPVPGYSAVGMLNEDVITVFVAARNIHRFIFVARVILAITDNFYNFAGRRSLDGNTLKIGRRAKVIFYRKIYSPMVALLSYAIDCNCSWQLGEIRNIDILRIHRKLVIYHGDFL